MKVYAADALHCQVSSEIQLHIKLKLVGLISHHSWRMLYNVVKKMRRQIMNGLPLTFLIVTKLCSKNTACPFDTVSYFLSLRNAN